MREPYLTSENIKTWLITAIIAVAFMGCVLALVAIHERSDQQEREACTSSGGTIVPVHGNRPRGGWICDYQPRPS